MINRTAAEMTTKSLILCSLLISYASAFGRNSHTSSRLIDRTSLRKPSPLYYIDHDPVIRQSIQLQPVTEIATIYRKTKNQAEPRQSRSGHKQQTSRYNKGLQDKTWNKQYAALLEFKRKHGHCQVPQNYLPSPKLGQWVMAQRRYYKVNKDLTERSKQRKQLLKDVGFVFKVNRRGPRLIPINGRDKRGISTRIQDMDDFVGFMVENEAIISEKDKIDAWRARFSVYQK